MNADRVVVTTNDETTQEANSKAIAKGTEQSFQKGAKNGKHSDAYYMGHNRNEYQSREMAQVKMECHDKCKVEKFSFTHGVKINRDCPQRCNSMWQLEGQHFPGERMAQEAFKQTQDFKDFGAAKKQYEQLTQFLNESEKAHDQEE